MNIPKEFTIHGHLIKVIYKDIDDCFSNRYGYYDSIREEIVVFKKAWSSSDQVELTETQQFATFLHELIHCFQWHIKGETNECEAQSYAGLIIEYLNTKQ